VHDQGDGHLFPETTPTVNVLPSQWVFDEAGEEVVESDSMARRIWWIDDYISADPDNVWTLPGTNQSTP